MNCAPVDLRSDTLTQPTPQMREVIAAAPVGDDVFGEDPSVRELEERIAHTLGKESALFVPTGTMSNQIAIRIQCQPGEEFLCEARCHIFGWEQAGYAQLSGVAVQPIEGEKGMLRLDQLKSRARLDHYRGHQVLTRLICLENTHNYAGGSVLPFDQVNEICSWAASLGFARHLDGARLFNAVVASGISADQWAAEFDTVSVCFSKGLGAPVGSALCGPRGLIERGHAARKLLGGGMRQAGILAAAALYALDHHVDRLAEDHRRAQQLAETIASVDGLSLATDEVDTNIVIFEVDESLGTSADFCAALQAEGVLMLTAGPNSIRAVTHLDIDHQQLERARRAIENAAQSRSASRDRQPEGSGKN